MGNKCLLTRWGHIFALSTKMVRIQCSMAVTSWLLFWILIWNYWRGCWPTGSFPTSPILSTGTRPVSCEPTNAIMVLNLIHAASSMQRLLILLSADAEKVFNHVSWCFMSATFKHMSLGTRMLSWISDLCSSPMVAVLVNETTWNHIWLFLDHERDETGMSPFTHNFYPHPGAVPLFSWANPNIGYFGIWETIMHAQSGCLHRWPHFFHDGTPYNFTQFTASSLRLQLFVKF